jgi:hypothetical protein
MENSDLTFNEQFRVRSRSFAMGICRLVEECDETLFWLEFIEETFYLQNAKFKILQKEASELLAVFSTTRRKLHEKFKS